ncbi:MAG TPA: formate dehydrogenase, partial [Methanomicrobiales archaeon]|nr:formate dehydrogenase [Methanomicrobiales archaeon]
HALQADLEKMFGHVPGISMELPVLALVEEPTERGRLASTGSDQIFDIFKK